MAQVLSDATNYLMLAWAPDGDRIAVVVEARAAGRQMWVLPVDGGPGVNISRAEAIDSEPSWAPDGAHIAWIREAQGTGHEFQVLVAAPDGSNQRILDPIVEDMTPQWSPNATSILAQRQDRSTGNADGLLVLDVGADTSRILLLGSPNGVPTWQRLAP